MIAALLAAAHAALPDPLPCNAEGIPLLVDDRVQPDDARRAHKALALPVSSWKASVHTMIEISSWPVDSVLLLGRDRPGVAWQAARPDVRPWLTLLAVLPAAQLDGLLEGESVRVDLASTPEAFRSFLTDALPALDAHTEIVLDVLTQLAPFPSKLLRGRIVEGGDGASTEATGTTSARQCSPRGSTRPRDAMRFASSTRAATRTRPPPRSRVSTRRSARARSAIGWRTPRCRPRSSEEAATFGPNVLIDANLAASWPSGGHSRRE